MKESFSINGGNQFNQKCLIKLKLGEWGVEGDRGETGDSSESNDEEADKSCRQVWRHRVATSETRRRGARFRRQLLVLDHFVRQLVEIICKVNWKASVSDCSAVFLLEQLIFWPKNWDILTFKNQNDKSKTNCPNCYQYHYHYYYYYYKYCYYNYYCKYYKYYNYNYSK